jgi:multiple sugar transport system substrate-binding protein
VKDLYSQAAKLSRISQGGDFLRRTTFLKALWPVAIAGLLGLIGSGSPPAAAASHKPVTLVFWQQWANGGGPNITALKLLIKSFEHKYPWIHVKMLGVLNNDKIIAAITGGNAPDVVDLEDSEQIGEWASKGLLTPLNRLVGQHGFPKSEFVPAGWKAVTVGGKIYGVPFMNFDQELYWNKTLFKDAGLNPNKPPTTIQQLDQYAAKLTKVGPNGQITQLGFAPDWPGSNGLEVYAWLFGGGWYNPATHRVTANRPQNIQALAWDQSFFKKYGYTNLNKFLGSGGAYLTAGDLFESGKIAMVPDGVWAQAFLHTNVPHLQFGVAPFPAPANLANLTGTTYFDTNPQVIPINAPHPQAAWLFIKFETTNKAFTAKFASLVDNMSQIYGVPETPWFRSPGYDLFFKESASSHAHVFPQLTISTEYETAISNAQSAVEHGLETPRQALDKVQSQMEQALKGG